MLTEITVDTIINPRFQLSPSINVPRLTRHEFQTYQGNFLRMADDDLNKIKDLALAVLTKRSAARRAEYQKMLELELDTGNIGDGY